MGSTGLRRIARLARVFACLSLLPWTACVRISVSPSCPSELAGDESGPVAANGQDTGAIATFLWEVIPASAGRFANPDRANTTFVALEAGEAILRLTASDGFFETVAECRTTVTSTSTAPPPAPPPVTPPPAATGAVVALSVNPASPAVGAEVTLTCTSVGTVEIVAFTLGQVAGRTVTLTTVGGGVATFPAEEDGEFSFRCVGETADGEQSAPVEAAVVVAADAGDGGRPPGRGGR